MTRCEIKLYQNGAWLGSSTNKFVNAANNECTWTTTGVTLSDGDTFSIEMRGEEGAATNCPFGGCWSDWQSSPVYTIDTTAPTAWITYVAGTAVSGQVASTSGYTLSDMTPDINIVVQDNLGGSDFNFLKTLVDTNNISRSVTLAHLTNCNEMAGANKWACGFTASDSFGDGSTDNNVFIRIFDNAGNWTDLNVLDINVDTQDYITMVRLYGANTAGVANDTNTNAWRWDFNIALGVGSIAGIPDKNKIRFQMDDWTSSSVASTIAIDGNAEMIYDANVAGSKTTKIYNMQNTYDTTQTVYALWDSNPATTEIDGNFYIQIRIPVTVLPSTYTTSYGIRSYSS